MQTQVHSTITLHWYINIAHHTNDINIAHHMNDMLIRGH